MRGELLGEQRRFGAEVKKDYEATVATWKRKPVFVVQQSLAGGTSSVFVGLDDPDSPNGRIWVMLDKGTKAHDILPGILTGKSNKKALAFPGTFTAKTMPGVLGSGPGGSSGDTVVVRKVRHPGTKARKWEKAIARKWSGVYKKRMQEAMRRGAAKSGHAI